MLLYAIISQHYMYLFINGKSTNFHLFVCIFIFNIFLVVNIKKSFKYTKIFTMFRRFVMLMLK